MKHHLSYTILCCLIMKRGNCRVLLGRYLHGKCSQGKKPPNKQNLNPENRTTWKEPQLSHLYANKVFDLGYLVINLEDAEKDLEL